MKPITLGKSFDFFEKVTVSVVDFPEDSQITFNFRGQQTLSIVNESANVVEYSFNGNTIAGDMTPGTPTAAIFFDNRRVSAIWFRVPSGVASLIRVEAWAKI